MSPAAFLALAMLVSATPLSAQGPVFFADEDDAGTFRDLTIRQLVDAADLLARPGVPTTPAPEASADATFCHADTLLFSGINTPSPGEPFCPIRCEGAFPEDSAGPLPAGAPITPPTGPRAPRHRFVVNCADADPGGVVPAWQPVHTEAMPSEVDQIPEPSAVLLLVGAAAWILLRRKL